MQSKKIAVIGLGYVGLPLAIEFGKKYNTIGFDINLERIKNLKKGLDTSKEISVEHLLSSQYLTFSHASTDLLDANIYVITVPTPIDSHRQPNLTPLIEASKLIGEIINKNDIVIYESTVYPGATEEVCIPIIEETSGLIRNKDFVFGYSPERINPGDKTRPLTKIKKVTSGSTPEAAKTIDSLYRSIITAGTFKATSIKVAEASKIIENTQRDVNIALINELSILFSHLEIDTNDVIDAASTKWNFISLRPGLVGGHCIGVDPYYLVHKSISVGYIPDIIRKSREINDSMPSFVSSKLIKTMIDKDKKIKGSKVLIMGVTFKENCSDIRNTKVVDLISDLQSYSMNIDVYDPWADPQELRNEYGIELLSSLKECIYDVVILAVAHIDFKETPNKIYDLGKKNAIYLDMKNILPREHKNLIRL